MGTSRLGGARPTSVLPAVLLLAAVLAGCGGGPSSGLVAPTTDFSGPSYTLRVLGGSELEDMRPILDEAARATGVTVKLTETGTIDGAELVASGKADNSYDAIWFSSNRYLALHTGALNRLGNSTKIMYSPVLLGLRAPTAHELGWDHAQVTWADISAAAGQHRFSFGMTNPAHSNSGFSALVGIATAIANTGSALDMQQVAQAAPQLRSFFGSQALSAGSSGWLSDAYQRRESDADDGQSVNGLVNYESVLLSLNASGKLHERLTLIYPKDGVVIADYPLTLLSSASDAARSAYGRLVGYLRSPPVQREIMDRTQRRPVLPDVPLANGFGQHQLYELPFPAKLDVVDGLIDAYFDTLRRPARTVYLLDVSGSMAGDRIAGLKTALAALTGVDPSLTSQFDRFHNREQVTMLPFSTTPDKPTTFDIPEQSPQAVLDQIRAYDNGLTASGETAIYDSLVVAYGILGQHAAADPDRINSIVLMTDGENNAGRDFSAFTTFYHQLPPSLASIPIFPILFGEGNVAEMQKLVQLTGGLTFDARTQSLTTVFKEIRGYQ
jgi:Ca-activated chloride channel family protein